MKNWIIYFIIITQCELFANNYGALLFNGNCITCHNETKNISAPSISLVKKRYLETFPKKEDFIEYMSKWVYKPDIKTTIMIDQIEKYELMPELGYDMYTLKKIAEYIYENDFKKRGE